VKHVKLDKRQGKKVIVKTVMWDIWKGYYIYIYIYSPQMPNVILSSISIGYTVTSLISGHTCLFTVCFI
jgi:hypothetical protein